METPIAADDAEKSATIEAENLENVTVEKHQRSANPPMKWTPDDAANFISSAIRETQKPTLDAIKKRGISKIFYAITCLFFIALLVVAGGYIHYLSQRLEAAQSRLGENQRQEFDAAILVGGEKIAAAAAAMAQTAADSRELLNTSRLREQLEAARKESQTQEMLLQAQKEKIASLTERLARAERDARKNVGGGAAISDDE